MITTKNFLIASVVAVVFGYFFGWFDEVENIADIAFLLAWFGFYQALQAMEINNKNLDKIEKRFEDIESKI